MGKEKHKKHKDKSKTKKEKKDKKHKKHRRRSSSDSSESDDSFEGADQQLQRERAAVTTLRDILSGYPAVRKELREMLWRVDQGEAADISGVPDPDLKAQLAQFLNLLRLRRNDKGVYGLADRAERILPIVAFVFDEPPRPRPQQPQVAPSAAAAAAGPAPAAATTGAPPAPAQPSQQQQQEVKEEEEGDGTAGAAGPGVGPAIGPIGPTAAPYAGPSAKDQQPPDGDDDDGGPGRAADGTQEGEAAAAAGTAAAAAAAAPARRVAGPAMPPRELLEAAAAAAEALQAAGTSDDDDDDDGGLLVGPPPPELVEELEAAPQDEREAEVVRIVKVLREHAAAGPAPGPAAAPAAAGAGSSPDAYQVLGVSPSAPGGEVKKRYMRLSLLIHPDKCAHPLAHEAFQAVATAAKVLQDSGLRTALDERRADAELRRAAEAAAAQQERERAWRIARGEEVAAAGPGGWPGASAGSQRETWMTDLPPERSAAAGIGAVSQTSVRAFSQRGKTGRGDTSAWTDNPEQRKAREAQALLAAASEAYVRALPAAGGAAGGGGAGPGGAGGTAAAAALDTFNEASRKKSLFEVHAELQEKAKQEAKAARKAAKKQKTAEGGAAAAGAAADGQDWPWRPFDRERDLDLKPKAKSGADLLKSAAALGSKFSGGNTQRHFL
ncbi:hypothetical protein Agub_g150 [Astrephomene gubernaculifera]|uniref:J domain-containing protein n=1 Tax=Astrephomene gubernaculifera TaxID=47775 RepID=A0AAD3HGE4_9CHLO|nr:hypothetical protein Agub_g150 [Astrephomene gubernaculifera]